MRQIDIIGDERTWHARLGTIMSKEIFARCEKICTESGFERKSDLLDTTARAMRSLFPEYWKEIEEISISSGMPPDKILFLNMLELHDNHGCSTLARRDAGRTLLLHNEDGDPSEFIDEPAIVRFGTGTGFRTGFFCYPGELAGSGYAWNDRGLFMTVNNLKPKIRMGTMPKSITSRAILDCSTINEAIEAIRSSRCSGGFHYMIAQKDRIVSIEKLGDEVSVKEVDGHCLHTNHYLHERFVGKDLPHKDSMIRLNTMQAMLDSKVPEAKIMLKHKESDGSVVFCADAECRTLSTVACFPIERKIVFISPGKKEMETRF